jgi:hypothetical protein
MARRGVSAGEVEDVLRNFDTDVPARRGRRNAYKVIGSRKVRATYLQVDDVHKRVWTVYAKAKEWSDHSAEHHRDRAGR